MSQIELNEDKPQVTEVTVNYHGGGKVALESYGGLSSEYGGSVSRKYAIPVEWDEEQVKIFELEKLFELREELDPIMQEEYDNLIAQRKY